MTDGVALGTELDYTTWTIYATHKGGPLPFRTDADGTETPFKNNRWGKLRHPMLLQESIDVHRDLGLLSFSRNVFFAYGLLNDRIHGCPWRRYGNEQSSFMEADTSTETKGGQKLRPRPGRFCGL